MKNKEQKPVSLRRHMITLVIICWMIPIAAVAAVFGVLLSRSYEESQRQAIESAVRNAQRQMEIRMVAAIEDSKDVSYDGIVRSSYRSYQLDGDSAVLYGRVNEYLSQRFSRDEKYKAVYISFLNDVAISSYVISPVYSEYSSVRNYRREVEPLIMAEMSSEETAIRFFEVNNELYMARNLLDGKFDPYASVVMEFDKDILFTSFSGLPGVIVTEFIIDGKTIRFSDEPEPASGYHSARFENTIDGHETAAVSYFEKFRIWRDVPSLKYGILAAAFLGIPMLLAAVFIFYRQVTRPAGILLNAAERIGRGERGYEIQEMPRNMEFRELTTHFNSMSAELKNQFEQLYREQQALQQAKIRALQSQINPHFLNNTLEVINWEARMADDEKVSAMIEALSTMLDAALDRDGEGMIPLSREIGYVDAYLYIIRERLGEKFTAEKDIEPGTETAVIPRLILQPIVENAVEHDITPSGGGSILIRVFRRDGFIRLETSHSGKLSPEDRENIRRIIETSDPGGDAKVGLQNVAQRIRLIYGGKAALSCDESDGMIHVTLCLPDIFAN